MTTICLVRHGETDWNSAGRIQGREDTELNSNGRTQAKECADYLGQFKWDLIVTSPLKRAKETANIINEKIGGIPTVIENDFIERDFGKGSGLTLVERKTMFPDGIIPGQEDWDSVKNRAMNALREIAGKYDGRKLIIVSHGGVINSILSAVTNGEMEPGKIFLKNGCINMVVYDGSDWKLKMYNYTANETA